MFIKIEKTNTNIENIKNVDSFSHNYPDMEIIDFQFKIGKILGLTPFDIEGKKNTIANCLLIGLILLMPILIYYTFNWKCQCYRNQPVDVVVLNGAEAISEFCFLFRSILGSLKLYPNNWKMFLETSNKVNRKLIAENFVVKTNIRLFWIEFFAYHVIFLLIMVYEIKMKNTLTPSFFIHKVIMYYQLFQLIFICSMAKMLRKRYNYLSRIIKNTFKSSIFSVTKPDDKLKEEKLKNVFSVYQLMYVLTEEFNAIFGWQSFLILTCTVFSLLDHAHNALMVTKREEATAEITYKHVVHGAAYPVLYIITTIALVMSCDSVEKSAVNVIATCHRHLLNLEKSPLRSDLQLMAKYMEKLKPSFSAAGFFQINQLILATIFTSITTYLIIIIQFQ